MSLLDAVARANPEYIAALYEDYLRDPAAVPDDWRLIFAGYELGASSAPPRHAGSPAGRLVQAYRELGHLVADLDPLGRSSRTHPLLEAAERDLPLDQELLAALRETYAGTLAVEYLGLTDETRRAWLEQHMEPARNRPDLSADDRRAILERLIAAEAFEHMLQARFAGQKRFSLEGGEALIPLVDAIIDTGSSLDVAEIVIGMPHRGRLNVLANVLAKPYEAIFAEFEGATLPPDVEGDGDVKYHLGWSHDRPAAGGTVHLSL